MDVRERCDLVMKGGITSGVAYPAAVSVLSRRYDFASIGGASAGAIAAAVTAAAQSDRAGGGFERLEAVRAELKQPGLLVQLFQPTKESRPLLDLLLALQSQGSRAGRARVLAGRLARRLWLPVAVGTAAVFAAYAWVLGHAGVRWSTLEWRAALGLGVVLVLATLLVTAGVVALRLHRVLVNTLPASGFGMCLGVSESARPPGPALTEWLHTRIQRVAGREGGAPLTFADLQPDVELRVMTTDLTRGRPVRMPVEADYLFSVEELTALFPDDVVGFLRDGCPVVHEGDDDRPPLRRLPGAGLPVVVATRMSLSFPVLLAAVPLWTVDDDGVAVRHWMSDGGISSNFPIHFFDSWVPTRPTFGLDLQPLAVGVDPSAGPQAAVATYPDAPPKAPRVAIRSLAGLLGQAVETMQSWRDTTQAELPGFHDRIAHIQLAPDEGGMNISMPESVITRVDAKGEAAGERLLRTFDWERHQARRYETFMAMLQQGLVPPRGTPAKKGCVQAAWDGGLGKRVTHGEVDTGTRRPPGWSASAARATDRLLAEAGGWLEDDRSFLPDVPARPAASMRVTPDV